MVLSVGEATEQLRGDLHGLVMDTKKYPNSRLPLSQRMKFALDASLGCVQLCALTCDESAALQHECICRAIMAVGARMNCLCVA